MARKVKHPEHANHERWLVSYADFITLLFAFFVVMFATSHADKDKQKVVSAAVKEAINEGSFVTTVAGFLGKSKDNQDVHLREAKPYQGSPNEPKNPEKKDQKDQKKDVKPNAAEAAVVELLPSFQALAGDLQQEIEAGKLNVSLEPRGLVVSMKEAAFFPAAGDSIHRDAYPIIEKVADSIRKLKNPVRLEGHTDASPIRTKRFPNNWTLAAARSIAMLELLEKKYGVDRGKMAVAGYADTVPIADNATPEGRAQNRRVDIIILNQFGLTTEPAKVKHQAEAKAEEKSASAANEEPKPVPQKAPEVKPAAPPVPAPKLVAKEPVAEKPVAKKPTPEKAPAKADAKPAEKVPVPVAPEPEPAKEKSDPKRIGKVKYIPKPITPITLPRRVDAKPSAAGPRLTKTPPAP